MTDPAPLVSCIMPTHDRHRFVPRAIEYFLRQTWEPRELVIIDDGTRRVADLVPDDDRIRYIATERRRPLGSKRNHACREARGTVIVHWDDDDWMAEWRLAYQVDALLRSRAQVCGLDRLYFLDPEGARAWLYRYPGGRPWVAGGTLCYRRTLWEAHPFPEINAGEDTRFVWRMDARQVLALDDPTFYVALVHEANTSSRPTRSKRWEKRNVAEVQRVMGDDVAFYRPAPPPPQPVPRAVRALPAPGAIPPADHDAVPPRVTVSIPYFRNRAYIRRAVDSILAQSYANLRVVVVNDGDRDAPWPALEDIRDDRLVRFDLDTNRGRYFADAVVLEATSDAYFLVQDADDWSEPHRVATLMRALRSEHAVAALSASRHFRSTSRGLQRRGREHYDDAVRTLTPHFRHRGNHHALFDTVALRAVGGCYAGFRVGYDTLLVNLMLMAGRVAYCDEALYNRFDHAASLTAAPATGLRSPLRRQAARELEALYRSAWAAYSRYLDGCLDAAALRTCFRDLLTRRIERAERDALERNVARLRAQLDAGNDASDRDAAALDIVARSAPIRVVTHPAVAWAGSLDAPGLPRDDWSLKLPVLRRLVERLEELRPRRILELGSGISTLFLARYAARYAAEVVSLEHDARFAARTRSLLAAHGVAGAVALHIAPLRPYAGSGASPAGSRWYDAPLDGRFDFILLDGPPQRFGREAALFALAPHLAPGWELWLDDGYRDHELDCIELWRDSVSFAARLVDIDGSGVWILNAHAAADAGTHRGAVGITILTGGRPELLRRTIRSLEAMAPGLLEHNPVVLMINGADAPTREVAAGLAFVDRCILHEGGILPIGVATSTAVAALARFPDVRHVLHIEDDWEALAPEYGWLDRACRILDELPHVGQVRLRHRSEPVLQQHMLTRRPIQWQPHAGFTVAPAAHYTFNPGLIRAADVCRVFPCASETEAQARFLSARLATAQLLPGVFRHIGTDHSLRLRLNR